MTEQENPFLKATQNAEAKAQSELFETRRKYVASWINGLAAAAREMFAEGGINGEFIRISPGPNIENSELTDFFKEQAWPIAQRSKLHLYAMSISNGSQSIRLEAALAPVPGRPRRIVATLRLGTTEIYSRLSEQNKFDDAFKMLVAKEFQRTVQELIAAVHPADGRSAGVCEQAPRALAAT